MNHKRKGPKSTRSGCMLCKPYMRQGTKRSERQRFSATKQIDVGRRQVRELSQYVVCRTQRV